MHMHGVFVAGQTYLQNLVQLFLVLHNNDVGLAVQGNVLASLGTVGGIDPSRHASVGGGGRRGRREERDMYSDHWEEAELTDLPSKHGPDV